MSIVEKWEKWNPVEEIPSTFYITNIIENTKGFFIFLKNDKQEVEIEFIFYGFFPSNRYTARRVFLKTTHYLCNQYSPNFYDSWSLFKVENSEYLKWLENESYGFYERTDVTHYVFMGLNSVFEVLAPYAPKVVIRTAK